jgi:hypothetical protein
MDQGTVAFLSLFVICILFLEQNRCKCAEDDEVEGHTSIPWWVFLIAGIWVVAMIFNTYRLRTWGDNLNFSGKFIRVIGGPLTVIFVVLLFIKGTALNIVGELVGLGSLRTSSGAVESWKDAEYKVYGRKKVGADNLEAIGDGTQKPGSRTAIAPAPLSADSAESLMLSEAHGWSGIDPSYADGDFFQGVFQEAAEHSAALDPRVAKNL